MTLRKKFAALVSSLLAAALLLTGCGAPIHEEGTAVSETGILTLSVNPEIQIEYNKEGKVTALAGKNDDGEAIVAAYPDYIGKECGDVLKGLIVEINEAGYFVEDIDGNKKNIVLQLEPGSVLPSDDFLANMSASTQNAVKELSLSSGIVTIDDDDYDPAYAKDGNPSPYITLEKAKEIALTQANVKAADAVFDDKEFDHDDGTPIFELEFTANGNEYEYDIHAVTGKVLRAEHEKIKNSQNSSKPSENTSSGSANSKDTDYGPNNDGVTDYDDTDYGPNNDGVTDYNDTDYGPNNDGVTDYDDTDYGPNNDGVTDYNDTDYGPNNDGVTDYNDTDYGPNNDGVTDYNDTDYGPNNDGVTDYNDNTDDGDTNYGGDTNYDGGGSDYSDDDDDDDDDDD